MPRIDPPAQELSSLGPDRGTNSPSDPFHVFLTHKPVSHGTSFENYQRAPDPITQEIVYRAYRMMELSVNLRH